MGITTTNGSGRIRTYAAINRTVFKTVAINHSATLPFVYPHIIYEGVSFVKPRGA